MGVDAVLYRRVRAGADRRRSSYVSVEVVADRQDVLLDLLARVRGGGRTPMLDRVEPLGELTVAAEQVPHLLTELRCLLEATRTPQEVDQIRGVARLAHRCREGRDLELRFEGD